MANLGDVTANTPLDKTLVGLPNVDNVSNANAPVSTAQATAIGLKQTLPVVQTVVPATGDTVTINAATNVFVVNPAAPLLTLFIVFPTGAYNGQQLTCIFPLAIVTVTVSGAALLTTLAGAGTGLIRILTWSATLSKWC